MPIFEHAELWRDVLDPSLDEFQAPELDYLVSDDPRFRIYRDPKEFFERTLVTSQVLDLLRGIAGALKGEGRRVYVLYSFFGGGKTHTLFTIYHAFKDPKALLRAVEKSARTMRPDVAVGFKRTGEEIVRELEGLGGVEVILVSGKLESLFPSPARPLTVNGVRVQTLWGYIAAKLGRYSVVSEEDRIVRVPAIDRLAEVLEGVRAVILIDEILEGVKTYAESGSEADSKYASQVVTFIDHLLSAAARSSVAVVITIPGEKGGDEARLESRYTAPAIRSLAEAVVRAIRRVAAEAVEPVASAEFWRIIVQRLFKSVNYDYAAKLSSELRSTYEESRGLFGPDAENVASKVRYSYPLHPLFTEILRDIIERNRNLQKTRDAIKISRIIVRKLYEKHEKGRLHEDMIMPWHIDPLDSNIATLILNGYDLYKTVVDTDLKKLVNEGFNDEIKDLARIAATTIFLKTYIYDVQVSGEASRYYPSKAKVALMTYDPSLFQKRMWMPADIESVLKELPKTLYYLWSDGEKYWFWYVANVNEIIERKAGDLCSSKRPQLLDELTRSDDYLKGLVTRSFNYKRKRLDEAYGSSLFEDKDIIIGVRVHPGDVDDNGRYRLVVAWEPDDVEGFEAVVTHYFKGGKLVPRQYKNTVVVLAPSDPSMKDEAACKYARIKAAEEVSSSLNSIFDSLRVNPKIRRAVADIQRSLVNSIKEESIHSLLELLLNGFNTIYYPASSGVEKMDASQLGITALNLVEKVESVLKDDQKAILDPDSISFDYFLDKLRKAGIDLDQPRELNEIIYGPRTDPSAPMMPESVVISILSRAVSESRLVAVDPSGRVIFPRIVTAEGDCPRRVEALSLKLGRDYKVVLTASQAAAKIILDYLKTLKTEETLPDGRVLVREVVVVLDEDKLGLEEFEDIAMKSPESLEEAILCVRKEVRERGIRVRASPETVKLRVGGSGEVRVRVSSIGMSVTGAAKVTVDAPSKVKATLKEDMVSIGGETILAIEAVEPGTYTITLRAETPEGLSDSTMVTVQIEGLETLVQCSEAESLRGHVATGLIIKGTWKSIGVALEDVIRKAPEGATATIVSVEQESGVELRLIRPQAADVAIELVKAFASSVKNLLERDPIVEATLNFGEKGIPTVDVAELLNLSLGQPVECRVKVKPST